MTVGIVDRLAAMMLNIVGTKGQTLDIIVENQGRINFGAAMNDNKKVCSANNIHLFCSNKCES